MSDVAKLVNRIGRLNNDPHATVPGQIVTRLVLVIVGLMLLSPREAQEAAAAAVSQILNEAGVP